MISFCQNDTALQQIKKKSYKSSLEQQGIATIFAYGVAFRGKQVEVAVE